ncbi:hypothetical protein ENBRE01_2123 [Enteropsectra breve]|nr:hypothetical protein ENBRE01_2123 [Enteropsectra breve]
MCLSIREPSDKRTLCILTKWLFCKYAFFDRQCILHRKFLLRTDHQALTAFKHTLNLNSIIFRWSLFLNEFAFDVEYINGEINPADALSRLEVSVNTIVNPNCKLIIDKELRKRILKESY